MPPNWISCSSSPMSFWAAVGNAWIFLFEFPSHTTGRNTGGSKSAKNYSSDYIGNFIYWQQLSHHSSFCSESQRIRGDSRGKAAAEWVHWADRGGGGPYPSDFSWLGSG